MIETDTEIINKINAGDVNAVSTLIMRHRDKSMTLAMRMLKRKEDAEEALQDAFVRALRGLKNFQGKSNFSTWLYRIVYNVCCDYLIKNKQQNHIINEDDEKNEILEYADKYYEISDNYEYEELRRIVNEEIDQIDPIYSSILTLFYVQEFGYDEIVNITGLPLGTVKTRLFRGRDIMRNRVIKRLGVKTVEEI